MFGRLCIAPLGATFACRLRHYVPDIQEFPGDSRAGSTVTAILTISNVSFATRWRFLPGFARQQDLLGQLGVQTNLDLTISEKGVHQSDAELAPSLQRMPCLRLGWASVVRPKHANQQADVIQHGR